MHAQALPNRKPLLLLFLALTVLVVFTEHLITQLQEFATSPLLAPAVTFDLVVGVPLLFYGLVVRRAKVNPLTLTAVVAASVAVATVILPAPQQTYLVWVRKSWVLAEPLLLGLLLWRLKRIRHEYRQARAIHPDLALNLETAFERVLGNPMRLLVGEIMVCRYGLFFWRRSAEVSTGPRFTVHRDSACVATLSTLLLLTVVEISSVHFLVARWSQAAALGLLVLSLYSLLFVVGHLAATVQQPLVVADGEVRVRVGLVWAFSIPVAALAQAALLPNADQLPSSTLNLARPLLTSPNVLLTCHAPITATGIYGLRKTTASLALYVDQPQTFLQALALDNHELTS